MITVLKILNDFIKSIILIDNYIKLPANINIPSNVIYSFCDLFKNKLDLLNLSLFIDDLKYKLNNDNSMDNILMINYTIKEMYKETYTIYSMFNVLYNNVLRYRINDTIEDKLENIKIQISLNLIKDIINKDFYELHDIFINSNNTSKYAKIR